MVFTMEFINHTDIDAFFNQLTECFVKILRNGLADFNAKEISFENARIDHIFHTGMHCVQRAYNPETIQIVLDAQILSLLNSEQLTEQDILKMQIIKKCVLCFQDRNVRAFSSLNHQLGSAATASYNDMKLGLF